jgi:SAM-dependent methyltransferase
MMTRVRDSLRRALARLRAVIARNIEARYLGVTTGGDVRAHDLGYSYGLYRGTPWRVLRGLFRSLEVAEEDVFVDVGTGMGRVVFMAARRPFKRVIGVERSDRLNQVAGAVIDRNRHRLACQDIELLCVDALEWEIPDDVTVVYLSCPFPDHLFEMLVDRLVASIDRSPRPMNLIYYFGTARAHEIVANTGRAQRISLRAPWYVRSGFEELAMFRLLPRGWA